MAAGAAAACRLFHSPIPLSDWMSEPQASLQLTLGENPAPVELVRPDTGPFSLYAQLGQQIFFDPSLLTVAALSVRLISSNRPLVQGCLGCRRR